MDSSTKKSNIPARLGFEELTEAVSAALLRAVDSRADRGKTLDHRITAGIWIEPRPKELELPGKQSEPRLRTLTSMELDRLSTRDGLSKGGVGRLNDMLVADPELGARLVASLSNDLTGTMERLFKLTDEEQRQLLVSEREDYELLRKLPDILGCTNVPSGPVVLAVEKSSDENKKKVDYEIEVKCEGGKSDGKGNWNCGGSFKIKF